MNYVLWRHEFVDYCLQHLPLCDVGLVHGKVVLLLLVLYVPCDVSHQSRDVANVYLYDCNATLALLRLFQEEQVARSYRKFSGGVIAFMILASGELLRCDGLSLNIEFHFGNNTMGT